MNFGYALLGLSFIFLLWGTFIIFSGFLDKSRTDVSRFGRLIRGMLTETVGLGLFLAGYMLDTKPYFAFLVFFGGLLVGSFLGIIHGGLMGRREEIENATSQVIERKD